MASIFWSASRRVRSSSRIWSRGGSACLCAMASRTRASCSRINCRLSMTRLRSCPGSELRKQDHFSDRWAVGKNHDQTVDADTEAAVWRHPMLHCLEKILIQGLGLIVAQRALHRLLVEPAALIQGIVQLAERVPDLHPADIQLEPL